MRLAVLDIGEGQGRGGEGAVGVEEIGVVGGDVGAGHAGVAKVRGGAVVGVELDREPVLDTADRQAAAGGSDGVDATGIVMEHEGRPVGPAVAGAEIDIEGDGKVLATSMRPVDIAVPAWLPAVVRVKTPALTLALPCGVSVTAPGGGVTVTLTVAGELVVVPSVIV